MITLSKQPVDQLDYDVSFDKWLPDGDTITSGNAVLDKTGELVIDSISITDQVIKVWMSGGVSGTTYKITVTAATTGGRIKETEFRLRVKEL